MNNRSKNYNSIVFLTTLSVYLGLVLVGGAVTPSVLAQAATTRGFDIKNEIVVEDDFDKNPDDCEKLKPQSEDNLKVADTTNQTLADYARYLSNLAKLSQQISSKNFSFRSNNEQFEEIDIITESKPNLLPKDFRQNVKVDLGKVFGLFFVKHYSDEPAITLSFDLADSFLHTKTSFYRENDLDVQKVYVSYNASLDFWRCKSQNKGYSVENLILQNTGIYYENSQVFIVTLLPRASIDALLARKDAQ